MSNSGCLRSSSSESSTPFDVLDLESASESSSMSITLGCHFLVRSTSGSAVAEPEALLSAVAEDEASLSSPFSTCFVFFRHTVLRAALAFRLTVLRVDLAFDARDLKDLELVVDSLSPLFFAVVDKFRAFSMWQYIVCACGTVQSMPQGLPATCVATCVVRNCTLSTPWVEYRIQRSGSTICGTG